MQYLSKIGLTELRTFSVTIFLKNKMTRRRSSVEVPTLASFKAPRFRNTAINPKLEIVFITLLMKSKQMAIKRVDS